METITPTLPDYTGVTTEQIVAAMLRENTGRALCDSGDAYGRNWSRNQGKDFASEPVVSGRFSAWRPKSGPPQLEANFSISLYHWMVHCLEFDAELQRELDEFAARPENEDEGWLALSEMFADHLHELGRLEAAPRVHNTYNDPDYIHLTQVLQYTAIAIDGGFEDYPTHVIVNVHGGCDVRGGYTAPKVFRVRRGEWYSCLELAHINGIGAGGDFWWVQEPTLGPGSLEPSDNNTSGVDDPLQLSLYTEEYLDESMVQAGFDPKEQRDIRAALTTIDGLIDAVREGRTLPVDFTQPSEKTLADLNARKEELQRELQGRLIEGVGLLASSALLLIDDRLLLVDGNAGTAEEVHAYSDIG